MPMQQPVAAFSRLVVLALLATTAVAQAQPFYLVADINRTPLNEEGSAPESVTIAGGIEYFAADDGLHGRELWRTDGTTSGTLLVKDIAPGEGSSYPSSMLAFGDTLVFIAQREPYWCALWRSDGTDAGTIPLSPHSFCDTFFGVGAPTVPPPVVLHGTVYAAIGNELWRSDGTPAGTTLVRRIDGASYRGISGLSAAAGRLFFQIDDGLHGNEPWTSDGTSDGTHLLSDLSPGEDGTVVVLNPPPAFVDFQGRAYFATSPNGSDASVWSSDGTEGGTRRELDSFGQLTPPALGPSPRLVLTGAGLFAVVPLPFPPSPSAAPIELWFTSGTEFGFVREFFPGRFRDDLAVAGSALYFPYRDESGLHLWRSDGTPEGTRAFAQFEPNAVGRNPERLQGIGDELFFTAEDADHGVEAWVTDGTEDGTRLAADIVPGEGGSAPEWLSRQRSARGHLLLSANDGVHGRELHAFDLAGARLVRNINDPSGRNHGAVDSLRSPPLSLGSTVLFAAEDGESRRFWRSDGSSGGTFPLFDTGPPFYGPVVVLGGSLYLNSAEGVLATDGSTDGMRRIGDISVRTSGAIPPLAATLGSTYYFGSNRELWLLDARDDSLRSLGSIEGTAQQFAVAGGRVFFTTGYAVWTSDGTQGGTFLLRSFPPSFELPQNLRMRDLIAVGRRLFFAVDERVLWTSDGKTPTVRSSFDFEAATGATIQRLHPLPHGALVRSEHAFFFTDGTAANTIQLLDLGEQWTTGGFDPIPLANGLLFFVYLPETGYEPWFTDGTPEGTRMLELVPGTTGMNGFGIVQAPVRVDDDVYMAVGTSEQTFELWRTDGTVPGTSLVREFEALVTFGEYHLLGFTPVRNGLLFSPLTAHGRELWITDGTSEGTRMLQDIAPGALSSSSGVYWPHSIAVTRGRVYAYADDTLTGMELWSARVEDLALPCRGDCDGSGTVTVDELIGGVRARLSQGSVSACPLMDRDASGTLSAAELRTAIRTALRGC